jgi:hypothetical protein
MSKCPRTARCERLCAALGRWSELCLGWRRCRRPRAASQRIAGRRITWTLLANILSMILSEAHREQASAVTPSAAASFATEACFSRRRAAVLSGIVGASPRSLTAQVPASADTATSA